MIGNNRLHDIILDTKLGYSKRILYLYIANCISEENKPFTDKNNDLKKIFNVSITSISSMLGVLEQKGYIKMYYNSDMERVIIDEQSKIKLKIPDGYEPYNKAKVKQNEAKKKRQYIEENKGFIYILKSKHGYKIGLSKNVKSRMKLFHIKLPFKFEIIGYYRVEHMIKSETYLHKKFKNKRLEGEWFDLNDDDIKIAIEYLTT